MTRYLLMVLAVVASTGCAAILNQNGRHLVIESPSGVKEVTENGVALKTSPVSGSKNAVTVSLDRSDDHVLRVTTNVGVATVEPQSQFDAAYAYLDGFLTLGIGELVDQATDDWESWRPVTVP
jgi:ligand-binding sensor domain-containing protein